MTSRVEATSSELVSIFHKQTGWTLTRTKFFVLKISALCKVQTVGFEKLASAFDSSADTSSSLRRIQRSWARTFRILIWLLVCYSACCLTSRRKGWQWTGQTGSLDSRTSMFWLLQLFITGLLFHCCSKCCQNLAIQIPMNA